MLVVEDKSQMFGYVSSEKPSTELVIGNIQCGNQIFQFPSIDQQHTPHPAYE